MNGNKLSDNLVELTERFSVPLIGDPNDNYGERRMVGRQSSVEDCQNALARMISVDHRKAQQSAVVSSGQNFVR